MDKNKAFLLQRQVKENTEDLQKEFRDMQAWEEQMKKKDFEIRNSKTDQVSIYISLIFFIVIRVLIKFIKFSTRSYHQSELKRKKLIQALVKNLKMKNPVNLSG